MRCHQSLDTSQNTLKKGSKRCLAERIETSNISRSNVNYTTTQQQQQQHQQQLYQKEEEEIKER